MDTTFDLDRVRLPRIGQLFSFVSTSPRKSERLSGAASAVLDNILHHLEQVFAGALGCRSRAAFVRYREEAFPQYMSVLSAMSDLLQAMVSSRPTLDQLVYDSLSELESNLREQGLETFGDTVSQQATFTVRTFRKIKDFLVTVNAPCAQAGVESDRQLADEFNFHMAWTKFHLDCLSASMRTGQPVYPDVLPEITEGLRAAVNAYALLRQGVELRSPSQEPMVPAAYFDEEEEELLWESMVDASTEGSTVQ